MLCFEAKLTDATSEFILLHFIYNFHSPSHLQASGQMNPQKAIFTGKLKVRGNFLLLQKLQSIF